MKLLRTIFERLSRGRIIKRKILVKGIPVFLFVSPDSRLRYLSPGINAFDTDLIKIAELLIAPESHVWDIGANVGTFTFAAASLVTTGTVLAIEADIWLATILRRSAQLNSNLSKNICILPVAVAETNSVAVFNIAERGRASNALATAVGRSLMGGIREQQYVPTLTLDTIANKFPAPNLIKIDVEGAELMVLQGAKHIITNIRPVFYIEIGHNVSNEIMDIFTNNRYIAYSPQGKRLIDACDPDTFFIPEENKSAQQAMETIA
jgi:FkbM family methyltransferase